MYTSVQETMISLECQESKKCVLIPGCRRSFAISCSAVQFSCSLAVGKDKNDYTAGIWNKYGLQKSVVHFSVMFLYILM